MPYYYLLDERMSGPVRAGELGALVARGLLHAEAPVWNPTQDHWIPCGAVELAHDDDGLMQFDDTAVMTNHAFAAQLDNVDLPPPRQLYALRAAADQGAVTEAQFEHLSAEVFRGDFVDGDGATDVLDELRRRGLINEEQAAAIQMRMTEDFVPDRIGNYEILEELGRGGMGITFRARQTRMDRVVALKVLLPKWSEDDDYIARFQREARMAARLNHEGIATAYEVGDDAGRHFLSMEFVEGRMLDTILAERAPLEEAEALDIVRQVCRALDHAHEHDVVHRDISPKNIIVRPDGRVKIIDMGLAKCLAVRGERSGDSSLTSEGMIIGTPAYMSPERACGEDAIDIRSDIYSLGCVLYEMLTGEPPLVGETKYETITLHINHPVPSVRLDRPETSDVTAHLLQRMTALDPAERYQAPAEVLEGLAIDAAEAREALQQQASVPPVRDQLAAWTDEGPNEIRLRADEREYVHAVARKLDDILAAEEADPEFRGYAQTLLAELVANAFDHGCRDLDEGVVWIGLDLNDAFFRLEVIDPGPGFAAEETLERIKRAPLDRERQRGLFQILGIADLLEYSKRGNHVKAVLYRKAEGSGVFCREAKGITYVEIKGTGDLAVAEAFRRWVETYAFDRPQRICLMVRTDWVSSMFVGAIGKLQTRAEESGSALSVWAEHRSCFRIMQQLGVTSFVRVYDSLESAELALRYASIRDVAEAQDAATDPSAPPEDDAPAAARSSASDAESPPPVRPAPARRGGASERLSARGRTPARGEGSGRGRASGWLQRLRRLFSAGDGTPETPAEDAPRDESRLDDD